MHRIAIIGAAPSSRALAPYDDPSWEIWGCSPSNRGELPRVTVWHELHALADLRSKHWEPWAKPYIEWLRTLPFVYMQEANDLVPNALVFPKDEIIEKYGRHLLTSSIAWQVAHAMLRGAEEIGLWGIDMSASSEYDYERPGCKLWIEAARSQGIKVTIPPQSDIDIPSPLYGFDDASPLAIKLKAQSADISRRMKDIAKRCEEIDREKAMLLKEHGFLDGCLANNNWVRKSFVAWSGPDIE